MPLQFLTDIQNVSCERDCSCSPAEKKPHAVLYYTSYYKVDAVVSGRHQWSGIDSASGGFASWVNKQTDRHLFRGPPISGRKCMFRGRCGVVFSCPYRRISSIKKLHVLTSMTQIRDLDTPEHITAGINLIHAYATRHCRC